MYRGTDISRRVFLGGVTCAAATGNLFPKPVESRLSGHNIRCGAAFEKPELVEIANAADSINHYAGPLSAYGFSFDKMEPDGEIARKRGPNSQPGEPYQHGFDSWALTMPDPPYNRMMLAPKNAMEAAFPIDNVFRAIARRQTLYSLAFKEGAGLHLFMVEHPGKYLKADESLRLSHSEEEYQREFATEFVRTLSEVREKPVKAGPRIIGTNDSMMDKIYRERGGIEIGPLQAFLNVSEVLYDFGKMESDDAGFDKLRELVTYYYDGLKKKNQERSRTLTATR